jgi:hypothetical protein
MNEILSILRTLDTCQSSVPQHEGKEIAELYSKGMLDCDATTLHVLACLLHKVRQPDGQ